MKFVDTHAHVFSKDAAAVKNARYQPSYDATPFDYMNQLNEHQMQFGVLIQPSFLGFNNSYMIDTIQLFPDRLKGVAVVPLDSSLPELKTLSRQGIVGARLNLFGKPLPDLTTQEWQFFLKNMEAVQWQVELHCPPSYHIKLLPELKKYNIPVVIDHFGRIDPEKGFNDPDYQAFLSLLNPEQHWIKVSGYYRLGSETEGLALAQQAYAALKDQHMLSHLVWGSDWPHTQHESSITYDKNMSAFEQIVTDPTERDQILTENAYRLFGFN